MGNIEESNTADGGETIGMEVKRTIKHYLSVALFLTSILPLTALLQEVREDKTQAMIKMDCGASCEHEITGLEIREGEIINKLLEGEK